MTRLDADPVAPPPTIAEVDVVTLRTVGIDVGSATSHLMFAEVVMARRSQELSSRYTVVDRRMLWESPVILTPYSTSDDTIDGPALRGFIEDCTASAGVSPASIDSGAVLLTGTALLRHNAEAIAEEVAALAGGFVCAAAGHHLEAVLAAHGSGAVDLSLSDGRRVVNVDVGGGTTKLAVVEAGAVTATAAVTVGSRLVAWDQQRRLIRLEPAAAAIAGGAGLDLGLGRRLEQSDARTLAEAMADIVVASLGGTGADPAFRLTPPLAAPPREATVVLSGGAMEWLDRPDGRDFGDLGPVLAQAVTDRLRQAGLQRRLRPARQRLRATVVGASQFSTQVSGTTIHLADEHVLPVHGVPAVPAGTVSGEPDELDVAAEVGRALDRRAAGGADLDRVALSLRWQGPPSWDRLHPVAAGIQRAVAERPQLQLVIVTVDADLSATLGRILVSELDWSHPSLICLDGLEIGDLDYLDIGRPSPNGGACPVVVKSLLFAPPDADGPEHRRVLS